VFLNRFNRAGIPFNIVLCAQAPKGIVLPEILTQISVLEAIGKCSKDKGQGEFKN